MTIYFFSIFLILVLYLMFFPGRKRWIQYIKLAKFKPNEKILYEESDVKITEDISGELLIGEGGGSSGKVYRKTNVKITNQRILELTKSIPTGIVNYAIKEDWIPKPKWLYFYRGYLINIDKSNISFSKNKKGIECLVVTSKERTGTIKRQYFFNDIDVVKKIFL